MRYYEIIVEAINYELTAKNWGPKLRERLSRDPTFEHGPFNQYLLDESKISDLDLINLIAEFDPTKKKTYLLNWILPRYVNGGINSWEDLIGVKDDLELFDRNKHLMPQRDIIQIRSAADLSDMIRKTLGANGGLHGPNGIIPPDEIKAAHQESIIVHEDAEKIVVIPKTQRAAGFWGRNTDWCTAWGYKWSRYPKRDSLFDSYGIYDGQRLLIVADKQSFVTDGECFQCYYSDKPESASIQIMDQRDVSAFGNSKLKQWIDDLSDSEIDIIQRHCIGGKYYLVQDGYVCVKVENIYDFAARFINYETMRAFDIAIDSDYYIDSLPPERITLKGIIEERMPLPAVQDLEAYIDRKYPGNSSVPISEILEMHAADEKDLITAIRNTDHDCYTRGYKNNIIKSFDSAMQRAGLGNYLKYLDTAFTVRGPTIKDFLSNPKDAFTKLVTLDFASIKKEYDKSMWFEDDDMHGEPAFQTVLAKKVQAFNRRS